jgi:hypothetical protein
MIKKFISTFAVALILMSVTHAQNPLAINSTNIAISQNFDLLGRTGTIDSILVPGWQFLEGGTGAVNRTYGINDGSSNTGNTYSYGTANSSDRAFGSVASGTLQSTIGAYFINNTGAVITGVQLQFTMEQWRAGGNRTTPDSSEFVYGINNGGFAVLSGTWTKNSNLNLSSKVLGGAGRALNGNDTANQTNYNITLTSLTLQVGDTLYLAWRDINVQGNDDGLAIDNFSITAFTGGGIPNPSPVTSLSFIATNSKTGIVSFTRSGYTVSGMTTLVFMKKDSAIIQGTPTAAPLIYIASNNFTQATSRFENDTQARCVYSGDALNFSITGLQANTRYHLLVYVVRDMDSAYSVAAVTNNFTLGNPLAVSNSVFLAEGTTSATISWTKPTEYTNASYNTLVFVKGNNSTIIPTPPASDPSYYTADTNYSGLGTKFESDTLAVCVYKGDANNVLVTGLSRNTSYQFAIFIYRESDSLYSPANLGNGTTLDKEIPTSLTGISISGISSGGATINWIKPSSYSNDTHQVVIFVKAVSDIADTTIHTKTAAYYNQSSVFSSPGTAFEHDAAAFCVYNGDAGSVILSGLSASTTYYVTGYIIKTIDTAYSNSRKTNFTTPAPPAPAPDSASNIVFTQTGLRTGRISWTKPAAYVNATHSTLVFVKAGNNISTGTPTKAPVRYTAAPLFGNGTKYDYDSAAYCVFRADTNFVNVINLPPNTELVIAIHTVRDADSVYSFAATGNGSMLLPALRNIAQINTTNPTTGAPDSNGLFVQLAGVVKGFNQRINGLQFLLSNNNNTNQQGITVFSTNRNFGYSVNENDSVWVVGTIGSNRGLCQITIDTLWKGSSSTQNVRNTVNSLNELSENKVIKLNIPVKFLNTPSGTNWPTATTNIAVVSNVQDTFVVRLLGNSALAGTPLPSTPTFYITGIGSQISSSNMVPFPFNGYQIIPRYAFDIEEIAPSSDTLSGFQLLSPLDNITIVPDSPYTDINLVSWTSSIPGGILVSPTYTFELDTQSGDFSVPVFSTLSNNAGADTILELDELSIVTFFASIGVLPGQTYSAKWRVVANSSSVSRVSSETFRINIVMPIPTGLYKQNRQLKAAVYPNPVANYLTILTEKAIEEVSLYDSNGKLLYQGNQSDIDFQTYSTGIYQIIIIGKDGSQANMRVVKK